MIQNAGPAPAFEAATARRDVMERSGVKVSSLQCKEPGRSHLEEQNDEYENDCFAVHGAETGFQQFIERADTKRGCNRSGEFSDSAGDDDHE